jgi:tetratricopeptide (TPR) repeat protein
VNIYEVKELKKVDPISGASAASLFSAIPQQTSQLNTLSNIALSRGIDLYQKKSYEDAVKEFKRAIGLSPQSENALKAYDFLATTYLQLDKTEDAIGAYKSSLKLVPSDSDTHVKLANLYYSLNRYTEAETEYNTALSLNPNSTSILYSLGQVYLATERYNNAESIYNRIISLSPNEYSGYYGLGQVYSKQGKYDEAIREFSYVINLKKDFFYAYADIAYAYADKGEIDKAKEQVNILRGYNSSLADLVENYIYEISSPGFLGVYTFSGFNSSLGPRTLLTDMSSSFSTAGASKEFLMNFIFNKDMDVASVQNPYNWRISRASGGTSGGIYNWGLSIPSTEIELSPFPERVIYDPYTLTAQVTFQITQNSSANGTIDPSHIVFGFYGKDIYGKTMDPAADEYSGISKIV